MMIFALDHIVFSATAAERDRIAAKLEACGFAAEAFSLTFPGSGAKSESWSFASGAFVEFVSEDEPGSTGSPWFTDTPRVIGLGFASDDFPADTTWPDPAGSWWMDESHTLTDGSMLRIHAAGPHEHRSDFYVFVMDRPHSQLEFPPRIAAPKLGRVTLAGCDADSWRSRLSEWLGVSERDGDLTLGDAVLAFRPQATPSVRASLRFEADVVEPLLIPLGVGEIAIVPRSIASNQ